MYAQCADNRDKHDIVYISNNDKFDFSNFEIVYRKASKINLAVNIHDKGT